MFSHYKYSLEKGSKKFVCPKCKRKKFVRYVNNETNEYLASDVGRCDAEVNCAYHKKPSSNTRSSTFVTQYKLQPIDYHPLELVTKAGRNFKHNNFIKFLLSLFQAELVRTAIKIYLIGSSDRWSGATVFWQIDEELRVRHGKIMLYDPVSGSRARSTNGRAYISSVRAVLGLKNFNLKQCLFGQHLLRESISKPIGVVESEKTAIVMSILRPEFVWLATGSKHGFKYEILKVLRGHRVIAFPDKGEYDFWSQRAIEFTELGLSIEIDTWLESVGLDAGSDLADIILAAGSTGTYADSIIDKAERKTELKVNSQVVKSHFDLVYARMCAINPVLEELKDIFDLTDENGFEFTV